jgi:hypothetical protein
MEILKVGLVIAAGLGSTWAARATTDALFGVATPQPLVQAAGEADPARAGGGTAPAAAGAGAAPEAPAIPEMSREQMDEEFRKAQAELGAGGKSAEMGEFRPTKPLPADLAISLPSDI